MAKWTVLDHIRQHDWLASDTGFHFIDARVIDNCATERILSNKFHEPTFSSDDEDDVPLQRPEIDWNEVFHRNNTEYKNHHLYVACMRKIPPYPKLSALTKNQHLQCLKVLYAENYQVLPGAHIYRPQKGDFETFKKVADIYLEEQKEYIEWAKTLWTNDHCSRALRPKPEIEKVYETAFKMKALELNSFPKNYEMAAHISLFNGNNRCQMLHVQDLINVNTADLSKIEVPDLTRKFTIMQECPVPEPCDKHPCWFILPNEKDMTELPLTEIHRELAQYASDNGAQYIASESALKCLVEMHREWTVPLSVCEVITSDGDKKNVLVFGSEFSPHKNTAMGRTYKAFRHLLEYSLISKSGYKDTECSQNDAASSSTVRSLNNVVDDLAISSDDDDDHLVINEDDECLFPKAQENTETDDNENENKTEKETKQTKQNENVTNGHNISQNEKNTSNDFYRCTCKDSPFEKPPPRSYRKWQIKNIKSGDRLDLIVHCSHKMKNERGEIIAEPIPEYQVDLGACQQAEDAIKSAALSLFLRENATLLNARVDVTSGEIVRTDMFSLNELTKTHDDLMANVSNMLYESLGRLQGLLPGSYILQHEPNTGANAFLYASRVKNSGQKLTLDFNYSEVDEAKDLKKAPILSNVLLPVHVYRKILPCAFTPYENLLAKETKKPAAKTKPPPAALRWPKRKGKKNRKGGASKA